MSSAQELRDKMIMSAALRVAVGDLADVHEKISNQLIVDCMLDDMTDLNLSDPAVELFLEMFTYGDKSKLTIGNLRGKIGTDIKTTSEPCIARRWVREYEALDIKRLSDMCSRGIDLTHLNQLLRYLGGRSMNESYRIASNEAPGYHDGSEYERVKYSFGINSTHDSRLYNETSTDFSNHTESNILRLLDGARFTMEEMLLNLVQDSDDPENYAELEVNYISVYMNDIEALRFNIGMEISELYESNMNLRENLIHATPIVGGDNFVELLLAGKLLKSPEYRPFYQRLKGKHLEHELGM